MSVKLAPVKGDIKPQPKPFRPKQKLVIALPFSKQWPRILAYMVNHPKATTKNLWAEWQPQLDDVFSLEHFRRLLKNNSMAPEDLKKDLSIKEQVAIAKQSFSEVKRTHAEKHLERIHKKLEEVHTVVDAIKVTPENVGGALDLVSRLHKEGRLLYSCDEKTADHKVTSLAILIGYDPGEKIASAKIVEVEQVPQPQT